MTATIGDELGEGFDESVEEALSGEPPASKEGP